MNWKETNARYVREGELLIDSALIGDWWTELSHMNMKKEGHPFEYPDAFIRWASLLKTVFQRPYRQLEGFIRSLSKYLPIIQVPSYKTLERRIKKLGYDVISDFANPTKDNIIAIDSSGIKVSNRSDWLRHKWKIRRGWLKLHIAVDVKTHQVIKALVTTEETGDALVAEHLIKQINCKKVLADGAYDKDEIFDLLKEKKIEPAIRTRKDAVTNKGSKLRREEVRMKRNLGEDVWKEIKMYGDRWNVEIWYSAYKRRFGERVSAISWKAMIVEILTNVSTLNWIYKKRCEL